MRIKTLLMAIVLAGLLFSLSASAKVITPDCGVIPFRPLNYETTTAFDKFDPSLGDLNSVTLDAIACAQGSSIFTNLDPRPNGVNYTVIFTATLTANIPGIGPEVFPISVTEEFHLFPGESHTIIIGPECTQRIFVLTDPGQLDLYKGAGEVQITVSTGSAIQVFGSTEWASDGTTFMSFEICPEYEYEAPLFCINGTKTDACTDEGIPGWTIYLKEAPGNVIKTAVTDDSGDYSFCNLFPGSYTVCEVKQAGWNNVTPICVSVTLSDVDEVVNFENEQPVCISGHKFNTKGAGLSGWTINLKDASGAVIKTTTTGTGGFYQFCDLVPGSSYTVCEVQKPQWKAIGATCIDVQLEACENSEDNDFFNEPSNLVCVCPFFIKNELYTASCHEIKEVDASKGILANDPDGTTVLNPETISIDPKYGTITVEEDGSFVYDPTGATALRTGVYVIFKYAANNGLCDSRYLGIAKMQISCK